MILSDYIKALQAIEAEHGDLEVETLFPDGSRRTVPNPGIEFAKILGRRESRAEFWRSWHGEERKGKRVVRV
jgi:hypothetical protein